MAEKYEVWKTRTGKWYFQLKAANGEVLAKSTPYTTKNKTLKGIEAVKRVAKKAKVVVK